MTHVHLDWESDRHLRAGFLDPIPAHVGLAGHVSEQIVRPNSDILVGASMTRGKLIEDRRDAERREDVCRNL